MQANFVEFDAMQGLIIHCQNLRKLTSVKNGLMIWVEMSSMIILRMSLSNSQAWKKVH